MLLKRNIIVGAALIAASMIDAVVIHDKIGMTTTDNNINLNIINQISSACSTGNLETVIELLSQHHDYINFSYQNGETFLMKSIETGYLEIAKFLINSGADVNAADLCRMTVLMYAAEKGYTDIVDLILARKDINIDEVDIFGMTALMYANVGNHREVMNILINHGADILYINGSQ